jgi:hypothetical protein
MRLTESGLDRGHQFDESWRCQPGHLLLRHGTKRSQYLLERSPIERLYGWLDGAWLGDDRIRERVHTLLGHVFSSWM